MKTKLKSRGFTIIEVLIVLAIAGLIMLIVFLAVPALQRNSRNTQRRNDIASILSAATEYLNNNNNVLPANGTIIAFTNAQPKLGYFTAAKVTWTNNAGTAAAVADPANLDNVTLASNSKCSAGVGVAAGASARSLVAVYDIEGSGGSPVPQCQES